MNEMYKDDFDGLSGNEDVGQMSAWYILSAMGLYQVEPAGGKYIIGSPIMDKATISLGDGKNFYHYLQEQQLGKYLRAVCQTQR